MRNRHLYLLLAGLLILAAVRLSARDAGKHAAEVQAIRSAGIYRQRSGGWKATFEIASPGTQEKEQ